MPLETVVIQGVEQGQKKLDPVRWWQAMERITPRALTPTASKLRSRASRGRTGKLSRGFDVRSRRRGQGLVSGIEAEIGARVPYGHLVSRGHRIIARGPSRKGTAQERQRRAVGVRWKTVKVEFADGTTVERKKLRTIRRSMVVGRRGQLRSMLKARRAAGPIGFVPGTHFAELAWVEDRANAIRLMEKLLGAEATR